MNQSKCNIPKISWFIRLEVSSEKIQDSHCTVNTIQVIMDYDYGKSSFKVQGLVCLIFNRYKTPAVKFLRNHFFLILSCIFIPSHVFVLVLNFQILLAFQTTHKECICFFSGASSLRLQSPKLMSRLHCPIRKDL